jgi:hypothetical protein
MQTARLRATFHARRAPGAARHGCLGMAFAWARTGRVGDTLWRCGNPRSITSTTIGSSSRKTTRRRRSNCCSETPKAVHSPGGGRGLACARRRGTGRVVATLPEPRRFGPCEGHRTGRYEAERRRLGRRRRATDGCRARRAVRSHTLRHGQLQMAVGAASLKTRSLKSSGPSGSRRG